MYILQFSGNAQTIPKGQDDLLHPRIRRKRRIELEKAHRLRIGSRRLAAHLASEHHVVDYNQASLLKFREDKFIILQVLPLVGININEVEWSGKSGNDFAGIADMKGDPVGDTGPFPAFKDNFLKLVIDFQGIQMAAGRQSRGYADG